MIGRLGPYTSASMSPTRCPRAASASARLTATVDFPTPPLVLATAMMRATPGSAARAAHGSCLALSSARARRTSTFATPGSRPSTASISAVSWRRISGLAVPGRRGTRTVPFSITTSPSMPSCTMSRWKPGKSTERSAARTRSGVSSAMRRTVFAPSRKGNVVRRGRAWLDSRRWTLWRRSCAPAHTGRNRR